MNLNLFNLINFLIVFSSFLVITSKNALHSILFLVSSFFFSALSIFLLENEFLALFFLIIYLGAIIILFLFVIMMLDLKHNKLKMNRLHLPTGVIIGLLSFCYVSYCFTNTWGELQNLRVTMLDSNVYINWFLFLDYSTDFAVLSSAIYQDYVAQILVSGVLLYTTTIGVVFLTSSKYKNSFTKKQFLTKQLARTNIL